MTITATLRDWLPRVSQETADAIGFMWRTFVASMLALYTAYALQLDAPYWSWVTVWIVAQPTAGMMLSKSLFRAIGTIAGAILAVVLIALFAQTPELFVLALALVVAACTVASNLLTNFRAYATVLTGYTAGIVASDAINDPNQIWFIAFSRGSAILLGIASTVLIFSIFAPHRAATQARAKFITLLKEAAHRAVFSYKGDNAERIKIGRQLILDAIALNTLIEFAAAESASFRVQKNRARSLLAHVFGMVSARRSLDGMLVRTGWPTEHGLGFFHEIIIDFLNEMPAAIDRGDVDELIEGLDEVHGQLRQLEPEREAELAEEVIRERYLIDRLEDLILKLRGALCDWRCITRNELLERPPLALNFHRDIRAAWINGLRAFVAVVAVGAFWIASAWPHGPAALVFTAIMLSLFSSVPRPDKVGWAFFYASLPAVFLGLLCRFIILPAESGFEYLMLATGLFLVPLGFVMANPKWNLPAVAFSLIFLNIVQPTNPMSYDLSDSLNSALGTEIGVLFGTLAYVLIFPPNPLAARRYVTYRVRRGLELMAKLDPIPTFSMWETRMYDRVTRLNDPQNPSGTYTNEWLDAGLFALSLGNEILRLRGWLERGVLPAGVADSTARTIEAFTHFLDEPQRAQAVVPTEIARLASLDPGPDGSQRREWAQASGAMKEINIFLSRIPGS